jgi:hypothetical protein
VKQRKPWEKQVKKKKKAKGGSSNQMAAKKQVVVAKKDAVDTTKANGDDVSGTYLRYSFDKMGVLQKSSEIAKTENDATNDNDNNAGDDDSDGEHSDAASCSGDSQKVCSGLKTPCLILPIGREQGGRQRR